MFNTTVASKDCGTCFCNPVVLVNYPDGEGNRSVVQVGLCGVEDPLYREEPNSVAPKKAD